MSVQWSFSSLKDFTNCPRQYHEVKVLQRFKKTASKQMLYGSAVHKALEDYTKDNTPLPKNYERFKATVDAFLNIPGEKYAEHQMALTSDLEPCSFGYSERWVRGIADLLVVDNDVAYVVDYKTGSNRYPDPDQLKLMALMVFEHFETVQTVKGGLMFVMHDSFYTQEYDRKDKDVLWKSFRDKVAQLNESMANGEWPARPTPLCGWCPVNTCEHHKER